MRPNCSTCSAGFVRGELRARRQGIASELDGLDQDIAAVERTLALTRGEDADQPVNGLPAASAAYHDLAGKSQLEAIVLLAQRNGGFVRVSEAKRMLIETRLTRVGSARKAYSVATSNLVRSKRFEWVAPGTYRLKLDNTPEPEASAPFENGLTEVPPPHRLLNGHARVPA
jgi:hypothetical protein